MTAKEKAEARAELVKIASIPTERFMGNGFITPERAAWLLSLIDGDRWIPVSERLPKKSGLYLLFGPYSKDAMRPLEAGWIETCYYSEGVGFDDDMSDYGLPPTHWRHLPTPWRHLPTPPQEVA